MAVRGAARYLGVVDGGLRADVIIVLGCAVRAGRPSDALRRRVALALRAHRAGVAERVIASGGRRWDGRAEATVMANMLAAGGVPRAALVLERCSHSTAENAWFCAALMRDLGARSAMVASSRWHLPRALAAFRRCGVVAVPPASDWLDEPPAGLLLRLRERAAAWLDAVMLARAPELR
jgi:uncharacterized SAM-binding protein YcdF (DUF218 family)